MSHPMHLPTLMNRRRQHLVSELQTLGLNFEAAVEGVAGRQAGAGPSDHRAVTVMGSTVMVPVHTRTASVSPYRARPTDDPGRALLYRRDRLVCRLSFPPQPRFYALQTGEGIPYWKIAQLHSDDVLATTVLQECIRYQDEQTRCQFCAIGESLRAGRTIGRKKPSQLAEVAAAAKRLDGITHMVMTTGTPRTPDRGARVLTEAAGAVSSRVDDLPIQAQCEPPDSYHWFGRLKAAGVRSLGMHLEALAPQVRAAIMPGKAEVSVAEYWRAFRAAVKVFGRGEVSTYLLAGLGDSRETLLEGCRRLVDIGVYPFVVPFVPITGTRLQHHPPPSADFMRSVLEPLGRLLSEAGMTSDTLSSGCAKCGACSSLSTFEERTS